MFVRTLSDFIVVYLFLGGLFSKTEMSEVLTEIVKADPTFDKDSFLKQCEKVIIPNILEVNTHLSACSAFILPSTVAALFSLLFSQYIWGCFTKEAKK